VRQSNFYDTGNPNFDPARRLTQGFRERIGNKAGQTFNDPAALEGVLRWRAGELVSEDMAPATQKTAQEAAPGPAPQARGQLEMFPQWKFGDRAAEYALQMAADGRSPQEIATAVTRYHTAKGEEVTRRDVLKLLRKAGLRDAEYTRYRYGEGGQ
jgi:hypothetical protein